MKLSQELIEQFLEIVKISKGLKKDIIVLKDDCLLGMDSNFATLATLTYDSNKLDFFKQTGLEYTFLNTRINTFLKNAQKGDVFTLDFDRFGINDTLMKDVVINEELARVKINSAFNRCNLNICNGNQIVSDFNIRECEEFEDILKLKTSDGSRVYKFSKDYIMYLFSSLFPVTKSDNVLLNIYDDFDVSSYMVDFHIVKKKVDIHEYIRFRKI